MKKQSTLARPLCLALFCMFASCKPTAGPWQQFMACQKYPCLTEVVAVKDAFIQDPEPLFEEFIQSNERGEDWYIGWIYTLRDSVVSNPMYATEPERVAMKQAIISKAREFENDAKYGDWAKSIIQVIENVE
ncbi:MAG: hypothetical protein GC192_20175 [Bacteroidetes bacterium]|nr:hypothetical protein [Bacteroidota bacterium]